LENYQYSACFAPSEDDTSMTLSPIVAPEVAQALLDGRGVVALESTLITHGLPWPDNVEVARAAEAAVRESGSVPATIALLGGVIRVGLLDSELDTLARSSHVRKASRRDLAFCLAERHDAATTVSATLWVARSVGIGILATGGLGGVHRGAATTFDISNDLDALARADGMAVVCSGVKSILDIPATLDALETRGVLVVGYATATFPAFTSTTSGLPVEHRVDTPAAAARLIHAYRGLHLPGAIVFAHPVAEAVAVPPDVMEAAIDQALQAAATAGITGKAVTPFLLDQVRQATEGQSLIANKALIIANARLAGQIATHLTGR